MKVYQTINTPHLDRIQAKDNARAASRIKMKLYFFPT